MLKVIVAKHILYKVIPFTIVFFNIMQLLVYTQWIILEELVGLPSANMTMWDEYAKRYQPHQTLERNELNAVIERDEGSQLIQCDPFVFPI